MKYFGQCKTIEELKKEYKKLAFANHPDRGGDAEVMKEINNEYERAMELLKKSSKSKQDQNSTEAAGDFIEIISNLINLDGLTIEIVGNWVWVTGETKPHKDELKSSGFFYASKKKAWYFKPADYVRKSRKNYSLEEIKSRYGSVTITETSSSKSDFKPRLV